MKKNREVRSYIFKITIDENGNRTFWITVKNEPDDWVEVTQYLYNLLWRLDREQRLLESLNETHIVGFIEDFTAQGIDVTEMAKSPYTIFEDECDEMLFLIILKEALDSLTGVERRRFKLHDIAGYSLEEIAAREKVSTSSVYESITTAKKKLLDYFSA